MYCRDNQGILTLFHTARHLKAVQLYHRAYRKKLSAQVRFAMERRAATERWKPAISVNIARSGPFRFCFLNQERELEGWNDKGVPKLWLYNLHYFDSPDLELMQLWIRDNPVGIGNGWEPYPLSRRIVNWIKWRLAGGALNQEFLDSLATQAEFLSKSLEYHLLANHLLANAKALVFAGLFFSGPEPERWLDKGLKILADQLDEQVLSDGGHFERSPMYHSLVLEDLLDLVNIAQAYPQVSLSGEVYVWKRVAGRMLGWLRNMSHPDGRISFFNDAAFEIAPEPETLRQYARRLSVREQIAELGESGYVRLENNNTVLIFDAAPIGPDYQPGHGHADTLSFEVSHRGRRVLVNSGTSTYEPGPERAKQRGTAAHNTVVVDRADQSEVWAAFRVARRARPFDVQTDHATFVEAAHDGYQRLEKSLIHRRRVEFADGGLLVCDTLHGRGVHDIAIYFHIHPDAKVDIRMDQSLAPFLFEQSTWHPEFNISVPNYHAVAHYKGTLPATFRSFLALK
jgi:uncharacterized heparinase superfamily protein